MKTVSWLFGIFLMVASAGASPERARQVLQQPFAPDAGSKKIKVAFFDADSTLRVAPSGSVSANAIDDVAILPNVPGVLRELAADGYFIVIVSNQMGISTGMVSFEVAQGALGTAVEMIEAGGGVIHYFDFAEGRGVNRKPGIGMARRLEKWISQHWGQDYSVDYEQSFMVGDSAYKKKVDLHPDGRPGTHFSNADRLFAQNLGIRFFEPNDFFDWRKNGIDVFGTAEQVRAYREAHPDEEAAEHPAIWRCGDSF